MLGLLINLSLTRRYEPPLVLTRGFGADYEWDSAWGVKVFHLHENQSRNHLWRVAREFLVGVQIKPQLDSYLRQTPWQKATGSAGVIVVKIIPFALPGGWGNDGLEINPIPAAPKRWPTQ
jgi:hypothetical protein